MSNKRLKDTATAARWLWVRTVIIADSSAYWYVRLLCGAVWSPRHVISRALTEWTHGDRAAAATGMWTVMFFGRRPWRYKSSCREVCSGAMRTMVAESPWQHRMTVPCLAQTLVCEVIAKYIYGQRSWPRMTATYLPNWNAHRAIIPVFKNYFSRSTTFSYNFQSVGLLVYFDTGVRA